MCIVVPLADHVMQSVQLRLRSFAAFAESGLTCVCDNKSAQPSISSTCSLCARETHALMSIILFLPQYYH